MNQQNPHQQAAIIIFLVVAIAMAGAIVLTNHIKAFGQASFQEEYQQPLDDDSVDLLMDELLAGESNSDPLAFLTPTRTETLSNAMYNHIKHCRQRLTGRSISLPSCRSAHGGCKKRLQKFAGWMIEAGEEFEVDPYLLAAMAYNESRFNPFAVGLVGERGVLQIHPKSKRGKQLEFVKSQKYRNGCKNQLGNCQREIIFAAADHITSAIEKCMAQAPTVDADNNLHVLAGLTMYNTGRCYPLRRKYIRNTMSVKRSLERGVKSIPWCDSE